QNHLDSFWLGLGNQLDGAAGAFDLGLGGGADAVDLDGELLAELAVAEHLDDRRALGHVAELVQQLGRDGGAVVEVVESADVDAVDLGPMDVDEAAFGHAPVDRQLAAFEPGRNAATLPLALGAATGGLTEARAGTTTDPLFALASAGRRLERV